LASRAAIHTPIGSQARRKNRQFITYALSSSSACARPCPPGSGPHPASATAPC
jgi:hypothetical protein